HPSERFGRGVGIAQQIERRYEDVGVAQAARLRKRFLQTKNQSIGGGLSESRAKQLDERTGSSDRLAIFVDWLDRMLKSGRRGARCHSQNRLEAAKQSLSQRKPSAQRETPMGNALAAGRTT